jgi:sugar phosphate isomerase/epimerase
MKRTIIVPSWVIPGSYLENIQFLEKQKNIGGVELLFFIYDDEVKKQFDTEWRKIAEYKQRFLFTAHLPEPLQEEHIALVEKLSTLCRHFIVHPANIEEAPRQAKFLSRWFSQFGKEKFLIENTNLSCFENLLTLLPDDTKLCMDTGHLLVNGDSPAAFFKKYRTRIEEIHLHGTDIEKAKSDGRLADHRPLRANDLWLKELSGPLNDYQGVINLELFSWEEVEKSLECWRHL